MPTQTGNAPSDTPATIISFSLTATNKSSVPGTQYFNVFPQYLVNPAPKLQILTALISSPTTKQTPTTTLQWHGGRGALVLIALSDGSPLESAQHVPVSLGDRVAVDWSNGAFILNPSSDGGSANAVDVTFAPGMPASGFIGLLAGPAPIFVPIPSSLSPLCLEPDLSLTATVVFGTPFQFPDSDESDVSRPTTVHFKRTSTGEISLAKARVRVGLDNLIVEIDP